MEENHELEQTPHFHILLAASGIAIAACRNGVPQQRSTLMLGIAVLFFAGLWLFATVRATRFGWRWGKSHSDQSWRKWLGAFLGFFLTFGWFVAWEAYHFTREQIWVTKFCTENPRLKIYITPEQLAEIIKTGDASAYRQSQPEYKVIDEEHIALNGESFRWINSGKKYSHFKVRLYSRISTWRYTTYSKAAYIYDPYKLVLFQDSEADTTPRGWLGLKEWYHAVNDCKLSKEEYSMSSETLTSYRILSGDRDEKQ